MMLQYNLFDVVLSCKVGVLLCCGNGREFCLVFIMVCNFFVFLFVFQTERAAEEDRLSTYVCLQTGHCQVQMVGAPEQGGKLHSEGEERHRLCECLN